MPINSFLYPGAKVTTGYEVANSLRFDDGSSEYLHRTPSSGGSSTNWTYSVWVKRSASISGDQRLLSNGNQQASGSQDTGIIFLTDDTIRFDIYDNGTTRGNIDTKRKFRDLGNWYHFVFVWNSSSSTSTMNGSATDRMQIWVNGVQETELEGHTGSSPTIPALNANDPNTNSTSYAMRIGTRATNQYFNGYIAEAVFVDGQSLGASSFGEFDEDSPTIWKPKDVSGLSLGTNGFYLDFEDSSSLGNDASGSNNLTVVNLTSVDQTTDTPTNNFCTLNSLDNYYQAATFSEGNCKIVTAGSSNTASTLGTFGVNKGKWFWEAKFVSDSQGSSYGVIGIEGAQVTASLDALLEGTQSYGLYLNDGKIWTNNSSNNHGAHIDLNAIIGVALDLDNNRIYFSKDGQWGDGSGNWDEASPNNYLSVTAAASVALGNYFPAHGDWSSGTIGWEVNFGNPVYSISSGNADANGYGNFEYAVPSGYYSLCTKNLAEFGG